MRMVSRSCQNCLEGPQNCPQGRGFVYFFAPGPYFAKYFLPGGREFDYLKKIPPGGCWCLELTDALFGKGEQILGARLSKA